MQTPLKCILPRSAWSSKRLRLSTLQSIATYTPMETYANIYYEGTNRGKTYTLTKGSYILFGSVTGWFVLC